MVAMAHSKPGSYRHGTNSHNETYWEKLRRQFAACSYERTGAYKQVRICQRSAEIKQMARSIERRCPGQSAQALRLAIEISVACVRPSRSSGN